MPSSGTFFLPVCLALGRFFIRNRQKQSEEKPADSLSPTVMQLLLSIVMVLLGFAVVLFWFNSALELTGAAFSHIWPVAWIWGPILASNINRKYAVPAFQNLAELNEEWRHLERKEFRTFAVAGAAFLGYVLLRLSLKHDLPPISATAASDWADILVLIFGGSTAGLLCVALNQRKRREQVASTEVSRLLISNIHNQSADAFIRLLKQVLDSLALQGAQIEIRWLCQGSLRH